MDHQLVSVANLSPEEDRRMRFHVHLKQDGGDPSQLLDILCTVVEREDWTRLISMSGRPLSFMEYITEPYPIGIGWDREDVENVLKFHHKHERPPKEDPIVRDRMADMRERVYGLIRTPLQKQGRPNKTLHCNVSKHLGNSEEYTTRRLRRDRPDLAEKVIAGAMSANKAAQEAGFRKKTITVPADTDAAARTLKRHFDTEQRIRLAELLLQSE